MLPSPVRRAVLLAVTGLVATLLPLVATAEPTQASASCTTEKPGFLGATCDDEKPPNTTSATGTQSAAGQVTVTANFVYSDSDRDPVGFQCQLVGTASWGPCVVSGLAAGTARIAIRAIDTADSALNTKCDELLCGNTPEVPDFDATPEVISVTLTSGGSGGGTLPPPSGPNGEPETQISDAPRDKITPGAPVALTRTPRITLVSSEPATFNCAINARKVPCHDGVNVFRGLKPGVKVFVAQAVDKDGKFDATPASITFYVPINLSAAQGKGWTNVKSRGSYASDYVSTSARGAVLTVASVTGVHEVRLVALTGPKLGKVAVRVGAGKWKTVNLKSEKSQKLQVFMIRSANAAKVSGKVQIMALKVPSGGTVAVDAIVAR